MVDLLKDECRVTEKSGLTILEAIQTLVPEAMLASEFIDLANRCAQDTDAQVGRLALLRLQQIVIATEDVADRISKNFYVNRFRLSDIERAEIYQRWLAYTKAKQHVNELVDSTTQSE